MDFEWDSIKAAINQRKHGIGFREAAEIFRGPLVVSEDMRRDYGEVRFQTVGFLADRMVMVVWTRRDAARDVDEKVQ